MLDWNSLRHARRYTKPFSWMSVDPCFSLEDARKLAGSFPHHGFSRSIGRDGRYCLSERTVIEGRRKELVSDLSTEWQNLLDDFLSARYRRTVQESLSFDLASSVLRVRLYRYSKGDWMLPHTDPSDRLTTHLIYLTEDWCPEYGGELLLLNSEIKEDVNQVLPPTFNTAVMFRPSNTSYHAVRPVQGPSGWERLVIIAQFCDPLDRT
jgi:Rps23 Pro-64 3,4-dihydroxylase Tpa1-like proline 4-hydroxylase